MYYWNNLSNIPEDFGATVVTIGNFDGVHKGHLEVFKQVFKIRDTLDRSVKTVAVTFDPHPLHVLYPNSAPKLLTKNSQKVALLENVGLDAVLNLNFTLEFAKLSAEEFVYNYFVKFLQVAVVVVGADVRFGVNNSGDLGTMQFLGEKYGFKVVVVEDFGSLGGVKTRWSSTLVRQALEEGNLAVANNILGRSYSMEGEVVYGAARGRELGFPTANLARETVAVVPLDGVYAGWLVLESQRYPVAISVGNNPTFVNVQRQVEAHVVNRPVEKISDFNLYGKVVSLEFVKYLRGMVAYYNEVGLVKQMRADVLDVKNLLDF